MFAQLPILRGVSKMKRAFVACCLAVVLLTLASNAAQSCGRHRNRCSGQSASYDINAYFQNETGYTEYFYVWDTGRQMVIWQGSLAPGGYVYLGLTESAAGYGDAYYRYEGQSQWNHKELIANGDTVWMY